MNLTPEQKLIWLAAFIDGEGHISASIYRQTQVSGRRHQRFRPYIGFTNTSVRLVQFAADIMTELGHRPVVHLALGEKRPAHYKPIYRCQVSTFTSVAEILTALRPYLVEKGEQADVVLAMIAHRRGVLSRVGKKGRGASIEMDPTVHSMMSGLKQLNHRGLATRHDVQPTVMN